MDVNQPSAIRAVDLAILRGIDFLISPALSQTTDLDIAQHSVDASPPHHFVPPIIDRPVVPHVFARQQICIVEEIPVQPSDLAGANGEHVPPVRSDPADNNAKAP